jgi:hypothetical protein
MLIRGIVFFALGMLGASCANETIQKISSGDKLVQVKVDGQTEQAFEYNKDKLTKEFFFDTACPNNTSDEFTYVYRNARIHKLEMTLGGFYSNSTLPCNSKTRGMSYKEIFRYDNTGRLLRIIRQNSYSTFEYNNQNLVTKELLYLSNGVLKSWKSYGYDSRGNLVQEIDSIGNKTEYE